MALVKHGVTADTPKHLMFSAGVFYKNLQYTAPQSPATTGTWSGTILGATSGGGKITIENQYVNAELDGAYVAVKGARYIMGVTGKMEINVTELTDNILKDALHLTQDTSFNDGFNKYTVNASLADADYLTNIAFVGELTNGKQVIVIMENALCTSAFEIDAKAKNQATYALTFECHQAVDGDLTKLPIVIYYPLATV